jgi:hypothetical protein
MKQIIRLIALSIILLAPISQMFAKIWIVNNAGQADYTTVQAAHDAATAGDTIYVVGSITAYDANVTLSKQLVIIGPGYFLAQNSNLTVNTSAASVTTITINTTAAGTVIKSMELGTINCNANNITISRNHITSTIALANAGSAISNIVITQNFMDASSISNGTLGSSSILIANNIFPSTNGFCLGLGNASAIVFNNIINGTNSGMASNIGLDSGTFQNNILNCQNGVSFTSVSISNNVCAGTELSAGNGNQLNVNMANVFVGGGSTDTRWQLNTGSPASGAGVGGVDCGAFGGSSPYVLSGIPPIPQVYFLNAAVSGSNTSGLPVTVKVRTNN